LDLSQRLFLSTKTYDRNPKEFLSKPLKKENNKIKKEIFNFKNLSKERFLIKEKSFTQQFSKLYYVRLKEMKPLIQKVIQKNHKKGKPRVQR
jgi:hypothetical protein